MIFFKNKGKRGIAGISYPIDIDLMNHILKKHKKSWDKFVDLTSRYWITKDAIAYGLTIANEDYERYPQKRLQYLGIYKNFNLSLGEFLRIFPHNKDIYDILPQNITIYRGGLPIEEKIGPGLNWTLTRSVAEFHAFELKKDLGGRVYKASIPKSRLLNFGTVEEAEVIAHIYPY